MKDSNNARLISIYLKSGSVVNSLTDQTEEEIKDFLLEAGDSSGWFVTFDAMVRLEDIQAVEFND
jgi:hypothetical protein